MTADLDAILEYCQKATGGPWHLEAVGDDGWTIILRPHTGHGDYVGEFAHANDMNFAVRARIDLPRLAAELKRARAVVEAARVLVGHVSVGNKNAAWIAATKVDAAIADLDKWREATK